MTVYATTSIAAGEEINIEYMPTLVQKQRDERQQVLKNSFGFICNCEICHLDGENLSLSNSRRKEINHIVNALGGGDMKRAEMWAALERMQDLLDKEGYKAMPEFSNSRISDAYVAFVGIKKSKQQQR